jgi:hypothetical protein
MCTTSETETEYSTLSSFRSRAILLSVAGIVLCACFFKISDLDFWWHLKSGQLILQQRAFLHNEVYSFTAAGREYIDHEWLFQVLLFLTYSLTGLTGIILLKSFVFAASYLLIAGFLLKEGVDRRVILIAVLLSAAGARTRFIERPEMFTILFLVAEYLLIERFLRTGRRLLIWTVVPLSVVWANMHAAVILSLVLQLIVLLGLLVERQLAARGYPVFHKATNSHLVALLITFLATVPASCINPYGLRTLLVPFQLTGIIDSGILNNQEWVHPVPLHVPLFYTCLVLVFVLSFSNFRRIHIINLLLSAFFGYISLKYIRNIGLFCVLSPLLVAPYLPREGERRKWIAPALAASALAFCLVIVYSPYRIGTGEAPWFPARIVSFTKQSNLQGNMINSYGFGGYLIWHLWPERKVFIDGRNEVYLAFLKKIRMVAGDARLWRGFLREYGIEYALLNYVDDLETVTVMRKDGQPVRTLAPFTSTHFPRSAWALVYWDDVGMVFVRREGVNHRLLSAEYTSVFPEGRYYQEALAKSGRLDVNRSIGELHRKLNEEPGCRRAAYLLARMKELRQ